MPVARMTGDSPQAPAAGQRLDSWKEIAAYLQRDVATVRRWEKREGLPVHRHLHERLGSVYAYTAELDAWSEGRRQQIKKQPDPHRGRQRAAWVAAVAIVLATLAGLGYQLLISGDARGSGAASKDQLYRTEVGRTAVGRTDRASRKEVGRPRVRVAVHRPGTIAGLVADGLLELFKRRLPDVDIEGVEEWGMMPTLRALDNGQADVGLAFNLVAFHAVKTEQVLGHRSDGITALTVAYPTPAQIVVRRDSGVKTIADLKGKLVRLGPAEAGGRFCSEILLSHLGFGPGDVSVESSEFTSVTDLLEGRVDASIDWRGMPVPDLTEAFASGKLRLIPLEPESLQGLRMKHPFLLPWTIPARVYPHQDSAVSTVSARMLLLASRSLSSDVVEQVMHAISAYLPDLIARHPAAAEINVRQKPGVEEGLSIDLHPGAERFFQSVSTR